MDNQKSTASALNGGGHLPDGLFPHVLLRLREVKDENASLREDKAAKCTLIEKQQESLIVLQTRLTALQTEHTALQTGHIALLTEHNALQTGHGALQTGHIALLTEHNALLTGHSALQTEHNALLTRHGALQTEHIDVLTRLRSLIIARTNLINYVNFGMVIVAIGMVLKKAGLCLK